MRANIQQLVWEWRGVWITTPVMAGLVILLRFSGLLQAWEWSVYDQYMRLRPPEPRDQRIAIVGLDEADMKYIGQGYVPDEIYADLIQKLVAMKPTAIGLDIYRDLPFEPGHARLLQLFAQTPNLIGIEKVVGDESLESVAAPPILKEKNRVAANDLILDEDNIIRRALLVVKNDQKQAVYSLGLFLAMFYLDSKGISPEIVEGTNNWWKFNETVFKPFAKNDGGYIRADAGGYQVFLNYRGSNQSFETVSFQDILTDKLPKDWGENRIILIGSIGESFKDLMSTPYTLSANERMSGVEIHAHVASQIMSTALDHRPLIQTLPDPLEWIWIFLWSGTGAILTWKFRATAKVKLLIARQVLISILATGVLLGSTYLLFINGWWIPVVPPFLALAGSAIAITAYIARSAADIRNIFGRYLSAEIVSNLLEKPEGLKLGGERRKITILTSDLRGFTALSERLQPEEVVKILNFYLSSMADVITAYQGTIDEFMGDGILVLFGAPTLREDDAQRAIACAVAMQLAMQKVNEKLKQWDLSPLDMGIGINTGEVVVGNIGSEKRTKYGVVGNQVNLAYRVESYTTGGQILISEMTLKEAGEDIVKIDNQKLVQPKGVKKPITIYEVGGITAQYNLFISKEEENFYPLPTPIVLQYSILEGKHIGESLLMGSLVELSEKRGLIVTEVNNDIIPEVLANLKINMKLESEQWSDDIYAKVLEKSAESGSFYIQFTAKPPEVEKYLNQLYKTIVI
ncbi:CHASE2 domain-containing protein [Planktothrix mougeotii]|uniref:Adenylate/guanylate cyclase domain-containing protein n=1 Tax=Planktothrix mougeotii LEGE 06226 TaxID=1828728 RepID=A0ABR9UF08_9CYAN|nr:adenylate/guanylate cyclase domain-containing protein [Planktothrix mougeotii]MBE9145056.1 adenylate/guanylate cyclase domain-containing protein [Planktothrix mougeotii LEGE 06226]